MWSVTSPLKKKPLFRDRECKMTEEASNKLLNGQSFFDKCTGKKYLCLSVTEVGGIKHYRLKSEESEDVLLLSESGLKIRFDDKPDIGIKNIKNLFLKAVYKK